MTKSRYNPKYKIKLQSQIPKDLTSTKLPSNLQRLKQKLLSGNGFVVCRQILVFEYESFFYLYEYYINTVFISKKRVLKISN